MIVSVIGLGNVGLPLTLELSKYHRVIAYDIKEMASALSAFPPYLYMYRKNNIKFTNCAQELKKAHIHIICVPTLIKDNSPDLSALISATQTVAKNMTEGDVVIYESSVYPGCTEEVCIPIIEKYKGDFHVAYSPERINPGDKEHELKKVKKIVSASDQLTLEIVSKLYEEIIPAGVYKCPSIKVAEAAKMLENTQRAVNIALMNEFAMLCNKMNINTNDVIEAARTKWNFLHFSPGLVGGNCIDLAPFYLDYKAHELGYKTKIIKDAYDINNAMVSHVANMIYKHIKHLNKARILILGAAYKENVPDLSNSKSFELYNALKEKDNVDVQIADYLVNDDRLGSPNGQRLRPRYKYDAIILTVPHQQYVEKYEDILKMIKTGGILFDVKGSLKGKVRDVLYLSL